MSCLCLGPKRSGKTHLLRALQDPGSIDQFTYSKPTTGTNIFTIRFPTNEDEASSANPTATTCSASTSKKAPKTINVLEVGGAMAPIWRQFFSDVTKVIYVVDTSNLCQISAAGVLLYSILADPKLQRAKFLIVLAKMDYAYRQMRNEALLILQMTKLRKEVPQNLTIVEVSAVTKSGLDKVMNWLQMP